MKYSTNRKYRDEKVVLEETKIKKIKKKIKDTPLNFIKNIIGVFNKNK
jgi:hypothetical protein